MIDGCSSKNSPRTLQNWIFDGTNYKHWSQKLLICFVQLEIYYVLTTDLLDGSKITADVDFTEPFTPAVPKTPSIPFDDAAKKKLKKDNKLALSYLLNNMASPLFDLFVNFNFAKLIWTKLDANYGSDDVGRKKYVVGKWQ